MSEPSRSWSVSRHLARFWRFVPAVGPLAASALSAVAALGLLLPLAALVFSSSVGDLLAGLRDPLVLPAIAVSLSTAGVSLVLVVLCCAPLAWLLSRNRKAWGRLLLVAVELPLVIPPAVAGVALLLAFGRQGWLGPWLGRWGIGIPFTRAAVVLAQAFVAAPFFIQSAVQAFRRLDPDLLLVARSLGASPTRVFFSIAVPLCRPALVAGAAAGLARALGEFGATLMFAGNLVGRTQTLPLAIYTALETDLRTAQSLSVLLLAIAFGLLLAVRAREWR